MTIDTFNGRLTVDSKQWLIGKYLYVKRGHEEQETTNVMQLLQWENLYPPDAQRGTVLNIGANIGMTCIGLIKAGYVERAVAFEPSPDNYRLLVRNIHQNDLSDRIRPVRYALSSVDGDMNLELSPDNSGDHRIRMTAARGFFKEEQRQAIKAPARRLDTLLSACQSLEADKIRLVWVDIQGHEGQFFQGARGFFNKGDAAPVVSEFWPYGILRSGLSKQSFCEIVIELFGHFYAVNDGPYTRQPIEEIAILFDSLQSPRQFCTVVLVPRSALESEEP